MALRILLALLVMSAVFIGTVAASSSATFYWASNEADLAVIDSDWGDARDVGIASCRGVGNYRKQFGEYVFTRFRCALDRRSSPYNRIGFVTIYTTGPESWKPANFIRPRCS